MKLVYVALSGLFGMIAMMALTAQAETFTPPQSSDDKHVVEADCSSVGVADGGYSVRILRNIESGKLTAELGELSFRGEEVLAKGRVKRLEKLDRLVYSNLDFKLDINMNTRHLALGYFRAKLSGESLPSQEFTDLNCTLNLEERIDLINIPGRPGGGFTCMAYFTGAQFDVESGQCVQIGRSGCSNPFEFNSIQECEAAYTSQR